MIMLVIIAAKYLLSPQETLTIWLLLDVQEGPEYVVCSVF